MFLDAERQKNPLEGSPSQTVQPLNSEGTAIRPEKFVSCWPMEIMEDTSANMLPQSLRKEAFPVHNVASTQDGTACSHFGPVQYEGGCGDRAHAFVSDLPQQAASTIMQCPARFKLHPGRLPYRSQALGSRKQVGIPINPKKGSKCRAGMRPVVAQQSGQNCLPKPFPYRSCALGSCKALCRRRGGMHLVGKDGAGVTHLQTAIKIEV